MKTTTLCKLKGDQAYVFRYSPGSEDKIIENLMYSADDQDTNFNWLDAAELCMQVSNSTAGNY